MMLNAQNGEPDWLAPVINPFGLSAPVGNVDTFVRIQLVDIDHDDILEAFVNIAEDDPPLYQHRDFHFYENDGSNENPDFVFMDSYPFGIPNNTLNWMWQFVDVNGDGLEDFVTSGFIDDNPVSILINIGSADVPNFDSAFVENPYGITLPVSDNGGLLDAVAPTFVDINNDGALDLFYGGVFRPVMPGKDAFYFSENTGSATDPQYAAPVKNPFGLTFPQNLNATFHWEGFEDVDCDGDFDMYFSGPPAIFLFFENNGTPEEPDFSSGYVPTHFTDFFPMIGSFVDIGGDGDLDLFGGSASEGIKYYENPGCPQVATEEHDLAATMMLFPNPASGFLTFELESKESLDRLHIEIFDWLGRNKIRFSRQISGNDLQESINLEDLPVGVYTLKVSSEGKFIARKFIMVN